MKNRAMFCKVRFPQNADDEYDYMYLPECVGELKVGDIVIVEARELIAIAGVSELMNSSTKATKFVLLKVDKSKLRENMKKVKGE